jgi:hypothetical protein
MEAIGAVAMVSQIMLFRRLRSLVIAISFARFVSTVHGIELTAFDQRAHLSGIRSEDYCNQGDAISPPTAGSSEQMIVCCSDSRVAAPDVNSALS